jgi:hypothetical protein
MTALDHAMLTVRAHRIFKAACAELGIQALEEVPPRLEEVVSVASAFRGCGEKTLLELQEGLTAASVDRDIRWREESDLKWPRIKQDAQWVRVRRRLVEGRLLGKRDAEFVIQLLDKSFGT